ncbi:MAG: alpha/beta fold hydrolase [Coriobacteriales bacterium]|nr:alpha/beta fold hydrolase [Coriobacteriales bacterium]
MAENIAEQAHRETVHFLSTDGKTQIRGIIWWPEEGVEPIGVVQMVHGMAEHIMRYEPFARYLNAQGFVACGHDHLGHGESVESHAKWGCLPAKDGKDILVGDVGKMRALMSKRVDAGLPYVLFGHSMGSFVVRSYISSCGQGLAGAVICGTGHVPPATSKAGNALARGIAKTRGEDHVSKLLFDMTVGAYSKAIENARTPLDWLSYNEANVDTYMADEACGFPFSAGGNATLTALTAQVCTPACCAHVPSDLPLLYIAGDADPVGDMGKGVQTAAQMARDAGSTDVTCTIYEHMRHEILNEDEHERVMDDVCSWIKARIKAKM